MPRTRQEQSCSLGQERNPVPALLRWSSSERLAAKARLLHTPGAAEARPGPCPNSAQSGTPEVAGEMRVRPRRQVWATVPCRPRRGCSTPKLKRPCWRGYRSTRKGLAGRREFARAWRSPRIANADHRARVVRRRVDGGNARAQRVTDNGRFAEPNVRDRRAQRRQRATASSNEARTPWMRCCPSITLSGLSLMPASRSRGTLHLVDPARSTSRIRPLLADPPTQPAVLATCSLPPYANARAITRSIHAPESLETDEERRSRLIIPFWESSSAVAPLALLT